MQLVGPFATLEGDSVLLQYKKRGDRYSSFFLPHLSHGKEEHTHQGPVYHQDVIGKRPGDSIQNSKGVRFRFYEPTLADWVTRNARHVTPIYPGEASNIVHHLDIHPPANGEPCLEILEAGTGHGSLTLYLARAIHGFNAVSEDKQSGCVESKAHRRAVVHSVERNPNYASHARKVVEGFRNGIYAANIDFHVADVGQFVKDESAKRRRQGSPSRYLSYVVLDLEDQHAYIQDVAGVMRDSAILAVFTPNVSQLIDSCKTIRQQKLPLQIESVFELGANSSVGKPWKIKVSQVKQGDYHLSQPRAEDEAASDSTSSIGSSENMKSDTSELDNIQIAQDHHEQYESPPKDVLAALDEPKWQVICRPQFGTVMTAGGFLGLFRRFNDTLNDTHRPSQVDNDVCPDSHAQA